jgi:molecular chaperone DnaJ
VPEGHRVVLEGEGEPGLRGGRHGDLIFVLKMDKGSGFWRDGADLLLNVDVPGQASALTVPHPDGEVRLTLPDGLDATCTVVATGLGLPRFERPAERGDLRVYVRRTDVGAVA